MDLHLFDSIGLSACYCARCVVGIVILWHCFTLCTHVKHWM